MQLFILLALALTLHAAPPPVIAAAAISGISPKPTSKNPTSSTGRPVEQLNIPSQNFDPKVARKVLIGEGTRHLNPIILL